MNMSPVNQIERTETYFVFDALPGPRPFSVILAAPQSHGTGLQTFTMPALAWWVFRPLVSGDPAEADGLFAPE
jgi:hypothetical protein